MILFNDETCQRIIKEMNDEMSDELNDWESQFAESNVYTKKFSPAQKEVIRNFADKYDFKSTIQNRYALQRKSRAKEEGEVDARGSQLL